MAANDKQVGGSHYKHGGEEHWDRVARLKLDYMQGQITKYVERWKDKNGIEDLRKAQHFLEKYIEQNTPHEPIEHYAPKPLCPVCSSDVKSERYTVSQDANGAVVCGDAWHLETPLG